MVNINRYDMSKKNNFTGDVTAQKHVPNTIEIINFNFYYTDKQALFDVNLNIRQNSVSALIGPSGCGKSTLLRSINRMNELVDGARNEGVIKVNGENIYTDAVDVINLRRNIGMVFQKSNPFPKSIYENVVYGHRIMGQNNKKELDIIVEKGLKQAGLWDEVKDRLQQSAMGLSGGQQQRLCIARALAIEPSVILMDEPCSALDPIATTKIEELIHELKKNYTIVIVTHNMQQAARVSDFTSFFWLGKLMESDLTEVIFTNPSNKITEDYISGRFG